VFGALFATADDRLVHVGIDGAAATFDPLTGLVVAHASPAPDVAVPRVTAGAAAPDGGIFLADTQHRRVLHLDRLGRLRALLGKRANPAIPQQDEEGVILEPSALLPFEGALFVACSGMNLRNGVQRFDPGGPYVASLLHRGAPKRHWMRPHGLALSGERLWVAETEGEAIEVHDPRDGRHLETVKLPDPIRRPFRIADDGHEGLLLLAAPGEEESGTDLGVAQLDGNGLAEGWAVEPGDDPGKVFCPFDLAVFSDGRFAVADLPLGQPPDVRVQIFAADGKLERVLFEDIPDLRAAVRRHFGEVLHRSDGSVATLYQQARIHHRFSGDAKEGAERARGLYGEVLRREPGNLLARMALGQLMQKRLGNPGGAEEEYRAAIELGGRRPDLLCLVAECRRARGDLDGAIAVLREAVEDPVGPEDFYGRVEELGSLFLERAGEPLEDVG
jgi:hypothetical protein